MYTWLIADGSVPREKGGEMPPHEAICFVNPTTTDAEVWIDVYWVDREPTRGAHLVVPAERSAHIPIGDPFNPGGPHAARGLGVTIPSGTPFSLRARSNVKMGCQYTRVLTTSNDIAIMTTYIPALSDAEDAQ